MRFRALPPFSSPDCAAATRESWACRYSKRPNCWLRRACRDGAVREHRDSHQRERQRGARSGRRGRRRAGGVSRAREPPRPDQQYLQGARIARAAGHAGGVHRYRLERTAFLHASDIVDANHADTGLEPPRTESIRALVAEGNEILVQVVKDPLGTKGARLTTYITLPSRHLVYMPQGRGVGVSARIEIETERERLRNAVQAFIEPDENAGFIVEPRPRMPSRKPCAPTWCICASFGSSSGKKAAHAARQFGARGFAAAPAHPA
jgi:hypothetical protein